MGGGGAAGERGVGGRGWGEEVGKREGVGEGGGARGEGKGDWLGGGDTEMMRGWGVR